MDNSYIALAQKVEKIMLFFNTTATIKQREKFIKLILETVWLDGKSDGIKETREIIKNE